MDKMKDSLLVGVLLLSLHSTVYSQVPLTTCGEIERCLRYTQTAACDSSGMRAQVCVRWDTDITDCAATSIDLTSVNGQCHQNALTVATLTADTDFCAPSLTAGMAFSFAIVSNQANMITAASETINIDGAGQALCQTLQTVCTGSNAQDFQLSLSVGACIAPCTSCDMWTTWSACGATCGPTATRSRTRNCPSNCAEATTENEMCPGSASVCSAQCSCTAWTAWGACSVTCGSGQRTRARTCSNCNIQPQLIESQTCAGTSASCVINGNWGTWSAWSTCPVTCGGSTQTRTRACNNPAPSGGGVTCPSASSESQACGTAVCSSTGCQCSVWSTWSACSQTCGTAAKRTQTRTCTGCSFSAITTLDGVCPGVPTDCPVNGVWSAWSLWSTCPVTCGGSTRRRSRLCNNPAPTFGGADCALPAEEQQNCGETPCNTGNTNNRRGNRSRRRRNNERRRGNRRRNRRRGNRGNLGA